VHPGGAPAQSPLETAPLARETLLAELVERADRRSLYDDPQWLALLHYDEEWLPRGARTSPPERRFFLAEDGDRNPRAELHSTLRAFIDPDSSAEGDQRPQCLFIARRRWLKDRLGIDDATLPPVHCEAYARWRGSLDVRGLTLVFVEGFMNNPASVFGHTLLRIDVASDSQPGEILGWAVDFTAETGDDGGVVYMAKGVSGRYPAAFGVRPYYQQLKRYSDWENRDIWEYRLDVDESQLELLLMHLWELQGIEFPYYFFTRNCSYELLRLLDAGIPELGASAGFRGPVIPVDTVRALTKRPGFVTIARYRPSPETTLRAALRGLESEDASRAREIAGGRLDPADESLQHLPRERHARILEVAYEQLRYEYLAGEVSDAASRGLSLRILVARSHLGDSQPSGDSAGQVEVPTIRPDEGHDSSMVAVSGGWRDGESFIDLRLRPAFHDLMDNGGGFPEAMEVRFFDTRLRIYPQSGKVRLQDLTLLGVASLSPRSHVFRPFAWSAATGLATRRVPDDDGGLKDASVWGSQVGAGLAWDPAPGVLIYGLADARLDVGTALQDSFSLGPGARLGVVVGGREARLRGQLFGEVTRFALGDTTTSARGGVAARLSTSRNTALTLECTFNRIHDESWLEGELGLRLAF
jgi:hypothetical protein